MKVFGVVMAGGGGTRFWPLSREKTPKQLLNLSGKDVMLNESVERLLRVADKDDVYIVTNKAQAEGVGRVTAGTVPPQNILIEPTARNTAACVGYAAIKIWKTYGDGVMVITPSDAYIRNIDGVERVFRTAVRAAEERDVLVTVGIRPTFAATGYGYILCRAGDGEVKDVERFVEKPDKARAEAFLANGNYLWNSGMFVWKVSVILRKFKEHLPELYEKLVVLGESVGTAEERAMVERIYPELPSISVDYGIMERSAGICVVPADFGWSDLGSWDMLHAVHSADGDGNIVLGDGLAVESKNTTVFSQGRLVAAVGVEGLVIVETADAVLVCPKDRAQDVKKIVDELKARGRTDLL